MKVDFAVVGAGIVGLAHALAAAKRGLRVVLLERNDRAVGASVRNFGLVWPIGQPDGPRHRRALQTREIWGEIATHAGISFFPTGSLHLAYREDEWRVLQEFASTANGSGHGRRLMSSDQTTALHSSVRPQGLLGSLWSPTEATVDPREAISKIPSWLEEKYGVELRFGTTVRGIDSRRVVTSNGDLEADRIIICSGPDFETLFPAHFQAAAITRCKLQMMRTVPQPSGWSLGPALCAGLTLTHYDSFRECGSLPALKARIRAELPFHVEHGIHVLVSEASDRGLTLGDSHHYGLTVDPFDREDINAGILSYLATFLQAPSLKIAQRWHGVYPKMTDGSSELVFSPAPRVTVVNGLGGAGMTMSFGLAEELLAGMT